MAREYTKKEAKLLYDFACGLLNMATQHDEGCEGINGDPIRDCDCDAQTEGADLVDELCQCIDIYREMSGSKGGAK